MNSFANLLFVAHELDVSEPAWVNELCCAAAHLLDEGAGVVASTYRVRPSGADGTSAIVGNPFGAKLWSAIEAWTVKNRASLTSITGTGVGSFADAWRAADARGLSLSPLHELLETYRIRDVTSVIAQCPTGYGLVLTSLRTRCTPASSQDTRLKGQLAAQLEVAVRLRTRRGRQQSRALSRQQDLVLRRLLPGPSDKEIASNLGLALSTVSTYAHRIRKALGCLHGSEAIALVQTDDPKIVRRRVTLLARLTRSEQDIVCRLIDGASTDEIAFARRTSARTVANQRAAIFRKCGVRGRRELVTALLGPEPSSASAGSV